MTSYRYRPELEGAPVPDTYAATFERIARIYAAVYEDAIADLHRVSVAELDARRGQLLSDLIAHDLGDAPLDADTLAATIAHHNAYAALTALHTIALTAPADSKPTAD